MTTTKMFGNIIAQTDNGANLNFVPPLTIAAMVKTMLEIISTKKGYAMDEETKRQFPVIAKGIILLAEQTQ